jgi:hypothetical protein
MKLPQFTLRDLFWLVLVAGCLCAWWADRSRIVARETALEARATELKVQFAQLALEQELLTVRLQAAKQTLRAAETLEAAQRTGFGEQLLIESPAHEAMINGKQPQ